MEEIQERYFAGLAARLGPRIDAVDREARTVVDEALADDCANLKAESKL